MEWNPTAIAWLAVMMAALLLAAWFSIRFVSVYQRLSRNVPALPFMERAIRAAGDSATYLLAGILAFVSSVTMAGLGFTELTGFNEVKDALLGWVNPDYLPFVLFGIAVLIRWARSRTMPKS